MITVTVLPNNTLNVAESTVSDGILFDKVNFRFPQSWQEFTKTAVFSLDDGETVSVVLTKENPLCTDENQCYIPFEVLKYPGFYISVFGILGDRKATATREFVRVNESGYALGDAPKEPTPDEYSQILNIAQDALDTAEALRLDAESGAFKGEKGDKGDKGDIGPKGDTGATGPKGDPGNIENIDVSYNPQSENAQSGKAVAEAIEKSLGTVESHLSAYFEIVED